MSLCFGFHFAHFQKEANLKSEAQDDVNSHVRLSYAAVVSKSSREEDGIFVTSQPYVNGMQLGGLTYPRARGGAGGAPKMVDLCIRGAGANHILLHIIVTNHNHFTRLTTDLLLQASTTSCYHLCIGLAVLGGLDFLLKIKKNI